MNATFNGIKKARSIDEALVTGMINENAEIGKVIRGDCFVQHIMIQYGVDGADVMQVLGSSSKEDPLKREKLAEIAAQLKKEYCLNDYVRNAELVKRYGRADVMSMANAAMERNMDFYVVESTARALGLNNTNDIMQFIPYSEEAKDLMTLMGDSAVPFKTHDNKGKLHIFFYDRTDAELEARIERDFSKQDMDRLLKRAGIKYNTRYKIFHLLNGRLTPTDNDPENIEDEETMPIQETSLENITDGHYRDDPMEKCVGAPVPDYNPERQLMF